MGFFTSGSINRAIALLILLAVLPASLILLNEGLSHRKEAINLAEKELLGLTGQMAHNHRELIKMTKLLFSTLALAEPIRKKDLVQCGEMLKALVEKGSLYQNFTLLDEKGFVLASAKPMAKNYLGDRKNVIESMKNKSFMVGEFVFSRAKDEFPALPFSLPILDNDGQLSGILTGAANLNYFNHLFEMVELPIDSSMCITDHKGIVIYSYPENAQVEKIGKPFNSEMFSIALKFTKPQVITGKGISGETRIFACYPQFEPASTFPVFFIWASVPQQIVIQRANSEMIKNLLFLFITVLSSLLLAWQFGRVTIQKPVARLIDLTGEFAEGRFFAKIEPHECPDELMALTRSFYSMADSLDNIQSALAQETERLSVTLKSIGDGVITTDTQGRILMMNSAAEEITGWTLEDAIYKDLTEVFVTFNESTRHPGVNPVERVLATGRIVSLENHTILVSRDGREKNIADSGAPIKGKDQKILGVILVFRDVTEENRIKQELIKIGKLESIGVLAGGIAHDFNNILAAILGNLELTLLDRNLSSKSIGQLNSAIKACLRAKELTLQLLTFARGGDPIRETVSLTRLLRETADFVSHGSKSLCRYEIPENLWPVEVDPGQIGQVIQNLVINAGQAMPDGGVINISCRNVEALDHEIPGLSCEQRYVEFKIIDEGCGIPLNLIDKIFDPFFSTKAHGHGLGLAICHSIVGKHGGNISVSSNPGKGSCFTVLLPVGKLGKMAADSVRSEKKAVSGRKIMVMDDEQIVRDSIKMLLEEMGHEVSMAASGEEAVELCGQSIGAGMIHDLFIFDLTVQGGMGGREAAEKILSILPGARIVVASGYSNDPVLANFSDFGFKGALSKPFSMAKLTELIDSVLGLGID
ncbi:MAG: ATP-binding protein [Candidatus Rifleibacteriota bacterium]